MRRALVLLVAAAAACGEPSARQPSPAAPAAPAPQQLAPLPPATPAPFEASFDDQELATRVVDAARSADVEPLAALKLPPRCDRVRVAVRVLHDELTGLHEPPVGRAALFAALEALSKCEGGASAKSLGALVAAWRTWTDADCAAEKELARRFTRALDLLRADRLDLPALTAQLAGAPDAPAKSPAAAILSFIRAAYLIVSTPDEGAVGQEIADAYDHASKRFEDLGWPGGFGLLADGLARRLLKENPQSFRAQHLADFGQAAYASSGDEVRASLAFLPMVDAAERRGELKRAEYLADGARLRLLATPARGRELFDVLKRHGELVQMLGRQPDAARDLGRALEEANWAHLDIASRLAVAERLTTSLFLLGRFAEAFDLATGAARLHDEAVARGAREIEPARTGLDEVAAQAAWELGRYVDAARLYRSASSRYEKRLGDGDPRWLRGYGTTTALAARSQWKSGDADGAASTLTTLLSRSDVGPPVRAEAASILREMERFDDAQRQLARAETEGGPKFTEALVEERARLLAARGDTAAARDLFRRAFDRITSGNPNALIGWDAARVLLDLARMEMRLGRLFEASEAAGQAVVQLNGAGLAVELDRARELYVDLQRQRLWFADAEKVASQRVAAGTPGDSSHREDALLDLLFLRIELLFERQKDAEKNALAAVDLFAEGWRRDLARRAVDAARGDSAAATTTLPADASPRWTLLRDVIAMKLDDAEVAHALCDRCGAAEPELRRWAAAKFHRAEHLWAQELRRRADAADIDELMVGDGEQAISIEPCGDHLEVCSLTLGHLGSTIRVEGDGGLAAFRDAVLFDPAKLSDAARTIGTWLSPEEGPRRLVISIPEPYGPLPFDLVPSGDGTLLDKYEITVVPSITEFIRARARKAPPMLTTLASPYSTLDVRHALVQIGTPGNESRSRLFLHFDEAQRAGADRSAALRTAKLAMRAEGRSDAAGRPGVPAWAAFFLRGAP